MTLTFTGTAPGRLILADRGDTTVVELSISSPTRWRILPEPEFLLPSWVGQPEAPKASALMGRLRQIKSWTGWSSRTLAEAVGTTHVTVEAILRGDSQLARLPQVAQRAAALYELAIRLYKVVGEDPGELVRAMTQPPTPSRPSALMLVGTGHAADAYLTALDVISPPRTDGMMQGRYPAQPGEATVALDDD